MRLATGVNFELEVRVPLGDACKQGAELRLLLAGDET